MSRPWLIAIIMAVVALVAMAAEPLQSIQANDQGEFVLERQARLADARLRPGVYLVHSEIVGGKHYVHFVEESKKYVIHAEEAMEQNPLTGVGEAQCATEQLAGKAAGTAIYFSEEPSGVRIRKVEIQGEDHAHML